MVNNYRVWVDGTEREPVRSERDIHAVFMHAEHFYPDYEELRVEDTDSSKMGQVISIVQRRDKCKIKTHQVR